MCPNTDLLKGLIQPQWNVQVLRCAKRARNEVTSWYLLPILFQNQVHIIIGGSIYNRVMVIELTSAIFSGEWAHSTLIVQYVYVSLAYRTVMYADYYFISLRMS